MAASHNDALSHEAFVAALERRFDFQSARAVATELLALAEVALAETYDIAAVAKLRAAAERSLTRAHAVLEALTVPAPASALSPAKASAAPLPAGAVGPSAESDVHAEKVDKKKKA